MSSFERARFQEAAVEQIFSRFRVKNGSKRMLLADEVGLGKTVVARGVIESLLKRRHTPLTVIYLCSNAQIAEQNRVKLDPESKQSIGRVTELALEDRMPSRRLILHSITPGTSLKGGTGLAWERHLMLYLLHRFRYCKPLTPRWREFFRCGAGEKSWREKTTGKALAASYRGRTGKEMQAQLKLAWRSAKLGEGHLLAVLKEAVGAFNPKDPDAIKQRNRIVAALRGILQRVALGHIKTSLIVLDEVQKFRDVLEEAQNKNHIASVIFGKKVPVLILSATPYRALTLGHEIAIGGPSHHEDFIKTLEFLFGDDAATPARIRENLEKFGKRLRTSDHTAGLDSELLMLKHALEEDLTKVICRTERNWYVLDHRKGVEEAIGDTDALPGKPELQEFFRLSSALSHLSGVAQVTEFWKSAPSLLTFLDSNYALLKKLKAKKAAVPRTLLTSGRNVSALASRNRRISRVVDVTLGAADRAPLLWTAPSYHYYRDQFFGDAPPRKLLIFSGWRFVPKAAAIITSRGATDRLGQPPSKPSQPLSFSNKPSFHVFDIGFPSPALARAGQEAFLAAGASPLPEPRAVVERAKERLTERLKEAGVQVVAKGAGPLWEVVMRLERHQGRAAAIESALRNWRSDTTSQPGSSESIGQHKKWATDWLKRGDHPLRISQAQLRHLALVAVFSPANSVLRALQSVYGNEAALKWLPQIANLCLGPMRRYFNRVHAQQIIRQHKARMRWRNVRGRDRGFAERLLIYAADAHLQAVLDEFCYFQRPSGHSKEVDKSIKAAISHLGDIWTLSRGSPRTNAPSGKGKRVRIKADAETHTTHFALAFGEDVSREESPGDSDDKLRKSVVREAFNSPFWPFVLATTSVGQEGLDFHLYCRDVLHWNLPSNPVDLEQREGRINRRDSLALRKSIVRDWPLEALWTGHDSIRQERNPWMQVFEKIAGHDSPQKYKHGLYPHWIYECRDPESTARIQRHVVFFHMSRDEEKYRLLKIGLALYRLVFGQVNQEDLLQDLQAQVEASQPEDQQKRLKRLASYMLNLSPIGHAHALKHAKEEALHLSTDGLLDGSLEALLRAVRSMQKDCPADLDEVRVEVNGLVALVRKAMKSGKLGNHRVKRALAALAYLRNPYDRIFDLHVEGGFSDDNAILKEAWKSVRTPKGTSQ
jgi:hypothetical protein